MRIIQLISSMRRAGAESVVSNLCRGLVASGSEVHLVVLGGRFDYDDELAGLGVNIHCLHLFNGPIRFYQWFLHRRIRLGVFNILDELRPDILHCHFAHSLIMAASAVSKLHIKTFYTAHGIDPAFINNDFISLWRRNEFKKAATLSQCCLLAVSESAARVAEKGLQLAAHSISVQPNPIDTEQMKPLTEYLDSLPKRVIMLGTLYPLKRVHVGIQAIRILRSSSDFNLRVVGDGQERARLEDMARSLLLEKNIEFLGVRKDVPLLLREAGIMWLLSEREGMPIAVLEAMASGVPVVATDVPGTNELIEDGKNGILVPLDDPQAVADATLRLYDDNNLLRRVINGGIETVKRFSPDVVANQHLERYKASVNYA